MIITKVTFEGKFAVTTNFLDETIGAEATLEEGETLEDGIIKLRERIRNVVKSYNTNLPNPPQSAPLPEYNKAHERLEIAIENATTMEELHAIGVRINDLPSHLQITFIKKQDQLRKD